MTEHPLSDEALGAALLALEDMDLHWWQRNLRRDTRLRSKVAHLVAVRVERTVRRLVAQEPVEPHLATDLPPFSGDFPGCPKCALAPGGLRAEARFGNAERGGCQGSSVEALVRTCPRCAFQWLERCADAPGPSGLQGGAQGGDSASDAPTATDGPAEAQRGAGDAHGPLQADPRDAHSAAEGSVAVSAASGTPETGSGATGAAAGRQEAEA